MWATDPGWDEVLAGDHWGRIAASAFYDGEYRGELEITGEPRVRREWDGTRVRSSASLTVADPDGLLSPQSLTSTLAPFGQTVVLRHVIGVGAHWEASIPLGEFVVTDPDPDTVWRMYRNGYLASGTVTVTLADLWERVQRNELIGLRQALPGASVRSEVDRMARGVVEQDMSGIPASVTVPASKAVYPESRAEALEGLLRLAGLAPAINREGRLAGVSPDPDTKTPVWELEMGDITQMPRGVPSDDGVHNVWLVTGEQDEDGRSAVQAILTETSGPLRHNGALFGTRVRKHSAPIYKTNAAALAAARTFRATEIATRGVQYVMQTRLRPELDVLDEIRVPIIPTNYSGVQERSAYALVTRIEHGAYGDMTVGFSVPWERAGVLA